MPSYEAPSAQRSAIMRAIRSEDTGPERILRALARGTYARANVRGLPGTPDLANRSARVAVFAHGCFWHQHACRHLGRPRRLPRANRAFWREKFRHNRQRDAAAERALRRMGWTVVVVWECDLVRRPERARARILKAFGGGA